MAAAGGGPSISLGSVSSSDTELDLGVSLDKVATGGGTLISVEPRRVASGDGYLAQLKYASDGSVTVLLEKRVAGVVTILATAPITGLAVSPGDVIDLRVQATGTSPTSLRAKAWKDGSSEPSAWTVSTTDSVGEPAGSRAYLALTAVPVRYGDERAGGGVLRQPLGRPHQLSDVRAAAARSTSGAARLARAVGAWWRSAGFCYGDCCEPSARGGGRGVTGDFPKPADAPGEWLP